MSGPLFDKIGMARNGSPSNAEPSRREPGPGVVTEWLVAWTKGDRRALEELVPLVYDELRRIARRYLDRRPNHSLQPTALINEAFIRLIDRRRIDWKNRAHFFGVAAKTMRGILIDHARKERAAKRGGTALTVAFDDAIGVPERPGQLDLVALDDALSSLTALDPELGELVELRFFGGLTLEETAAVMGVSTGTVKRSWKSARSWLRREMLRGTDSS